MDQIAYDEVGVPVDTLLLFSRVLSSMENELRELWILAEKTGIIKTAWSR